MENDNTKGAKKAPKGLGASLSKWLNKEGVTKNVPEGVKKSNNDPLGASKSQEKPKAQPKPRPKNTNGGRDNGKQNHKSRGNARNFANGRHRGGMPKPGKHDPLADKPTHEARDKDHITNTMKKPSGDIRVVPLGGMEQVGMNMMFIEWGDDILILDCGFLFPDPEHLGIDVLVPDVKYLVKNKHKIKGIIITHGHLDHIGAVPFLMKDLGYPPIYATKLAKELILANSEEYEDPKKFTIKEVTPKTKLRLGKFPVEFFHVNHSIPDGVGIVVNSPYGAIVHTSDFKIDHNPSDDQPSDLGRIAEIGANGVALAMVDSTNAMKPGHTKSESVVDKELAEIVEETEGRLIITTFASSIGRISKIVEAAEKAGRTVFMSGRSMEKNLAIARKLNYLKCKDRTLQRMNSSATKMPGNKVLILSTGSQGEELAALTRMAAGRHKDVKLKKTDTIVFSSSPIPGNETAIVKVKNNLAEIGLRTIDHTQSDVYVSGHGYQEELITMTTLLNPKNFAPIHGELYMRYGHRDLVEKRLGFKRERTFIMKNGQGCVLNAKGCRLMTESEKVHTIMQMYEFGRRVPQNVLQDRQCIGDSGMSCIILQTKDSKIANLTIKNRGDARLKKGTKLMERLEKETKETYTKMQASAQTKAQLEGMIAKAAHKVLYERGKKDPIIDVVIL